MLSCTGNRNTAPETPTGLVMVEISSPAVKPRSAVSQVTGSGAASLC